MPAGIGYSRIVVKQDSSKAVHRDAKDKVKVGFIVGPKTCDPILKGTQCKDWPEELKVKNNTGPNASGWGGQYQVDVAIGLNLQRLYPDVLSVDIIPGSEVTEARLSKNHLSFNIGYDLVNASMSKDKRHMAAFKRAITSEKSQLWPEWPLQEFVYRKDLYLRALRKAGVAIIDSLFVDDGLKPNQVLKMVKAKKWGRFFVKPSYLGSFGLAGGKFVTKECEADPSILQKFQDEDAAGYKRFLIQPFTVKPNGKVFDEVRHYFLDGEWGYSVYTDGTDDEAVYALKEKDPKMEPTREIARRAYKVFCGLAHWRGQVVKPVLTRIDVGVMPNPSSKGALKVFINEIELDAATWLVRYAPFDLAKRMCDLYPKKILEFLGHLSRTDKGRVPSSPAMEKLKAVVDGIGQRQPPALKRKASLSAAGQAKRQRISRTA